MHAPTHVEGEIPLLAAIVESKIFSRFILAVILLGAVLVGLETSPSVMAKYGETIHWGDQFIIWTFAVEAFLKIARYGRKPWRYFQDPWNVFDFTIVVVCFLPVDAQYVAVLRLARIMRVMRLMSALPQLQTLVGALVKSIPSMFYVGILLTLTFYVYAVMGVFMFGKNDPAHFHDLPTAMLTLFAIVTLEGWVDVLQIQFWGSNVVDYENFTGINPVPSAQPVVSVIYFVSFILFGTMIMLNLFIGVILNSMTEEQEDRQREAIENRREEGTLPSMADEIQLVEQQFSELQNALTNLRLRAETAVAKE